MAILLVKLTLAPALVALATAVARRLGHRAGGLVGGLPVVAAPVVLVYALEQGRPYAAESAEATMLGISSLVAFCVAYGAVALRTGWPGAVLAGWAAFLAATAGFAALDVPAPAALALVLAAIAAAARLHRRLAHGAVAPGARTDLLLRLGVTAVLVLALTGIADHLDARLAGLLAPFPIITAVLAAFTHARAGGEAANELLAGLVPGLLSFALFFAVLAPLLDRVPTGPAFAGATGVALASHAVLIARARRAAPPPPTERPRTAA